ncbi:hypothetical protein FMEAI12_4320028 [Parafrankia sp. Ea1.12]|nr:hypothetical protein FMEAI12_4320028 [Parafrankia sp. Ea1.12]
MSDRVVLTAAHVVAEPDSPILGPMSIPLFPSGSTPPGRRSPARQPRRPCDDLTQTRTHRRILWLILPNRHESTEADSKILDQYTAQAEKVLLCPGTAQPGAPRLI